MPIGRLIAVKRRCGIGSKILSKAIKVAKDMLQATIIKIEAQLYAKELYQKKGFRQISEEFLEVGILPVLMILDCALGQSFVYFINLIIRIWNNLVHFSKPRFLQYSDKIGIILPCYV